MGDRRLKIILVIALGVAVGLALAVGTASHTPARPGPASPERAMLDAYRGTPGDAELGRLFSELNVLHFDGRLPAVKVTWASGLDRFDAGDYRLNGMTDGSIILLKTVLQGDEGETRRTLCHEMVHVKLIAAGNTSTAHDGGFQQELRRLLDEGCFHALWSSPDERAALKGWIETERNRLDAARARIEEQSASVQEESDRVDRAFAELNERIRIANAAGSGWPSPGETDDAERQKVALNGSIAAYNAAVAANAADQARFNEEVRRYNLMLAYPDGLAEDRAKGLIR
jgi:hypothetical protein